VLRGPLGPRSEWVPRAVRPEEKRGRRTVRSERKEVGGPLGPREGRSEDRIEDRQVREVNGNTVRSKRREDRRTVRSQK
jgi:hypothetical protein